MADILSPQMIRFELMSKIWRFILEYESDPYPEHRLADSDTHFYAVSAHTFLARISPYQPVIGIMQQLIKAARASCTNFWPVLARISPY